MKINELSKMSRVNTETIRMYRNKGLLLPRQGENGYYEYSAEDLQALLHIRKLRSMNVSLRAISYSYTHSDIDDLLSGIHREYELLEDKLEELKRQEFMLKVTMEHFESYRENGDGVMAVEIPDDRYDLFLEENGGDRKLQPWLENMELFTLGLNLPAEALCGENLPETIPFRLTIGTYAPILARRRLEVPKEAVFVPKGTYLATKIEIGEERILHREQLEPLIRYARENGYRILGDTTAFLFRVKQEKNSLRIRYRLRVRVEKNEPA